MTNETGYPATPGLEASAKRVSGAYAQADVQKPLVPMIPENVAARVVLEFREALLADLRARGDGYARRSRAALSRTEALEFRGAAMVCSEMIEYWSRVEIGP